MKIAAAYIHSVPGNIEHNIAETVQLINKLEQEGVEFILFPELNISGYINTPKLLSEVCAKKQSVLNRLKTISVKKAVTFAIGFPENENSYYYISQYLFYRGKIGGIHRKTHLGPTEQQLFTAGDTLHIHKAKNLSLGLQLCFETHFPEISYAQARQGASILCMAFASPRESSEIKLERFKRFLCARAYDNSCYVVACNLAGITSGGKRLSGLSLIIDPKGNILSESVHPGSGYCIAEFDQGTIEHIHQSKMAWFNRFKRHELFSQYYDKSTLQKI